MAYDLRTITHGVEQGFYAEVEYDNSSGTYSFGDIYSFTGLRTVSVETEQESTNFYADDQVHLTITGNKSMSGSITLYQLPQNFLTNHLGYSVDSNGALTDTGTYKPFAFGYVELVTDALGNTTEQLKVYYNCKASAPTSESTTDEDAAEAKEIEVPITISPSQFVRDNGRAVSELTLKKTDLNAATFDGAKKTIYMPTNA